MKKLFFITLLLPLIFNASGYSPEDKRTMSKGTFRGALTGLGVSGALFFVFKRALPLEDKNLNLKPEFYSLMALFTTYLTGLGILIGREIAYPLTIQGKLNQTMVTLGHAMLPELDTNNEEEFIKQINALYFTNYFSDCTKKFPTPIIAAQHDIERKISHSESAIKQLRNLRADSSVINDSKMMTNVEHSLDLARKIDHTLKHYRCILRTL